MAIKICSLGGVIMANRKAREKNDIDRMLDGIDFHGMTADDITRQDGLLKQLSSRMLEKMLQAEMDEHLGYVMNQNRYHTLLKQEMINGIFIKAQNADLAEGSST